MLQFVHVGSCPVTGRHWVSGSVSFASPVTYLYILIRPIQPLITFVSLCWTCSSVPTSYFTREPATGHSIPDGFQQHWAEGKDHLTTPASNALPATAQGAVGCLGCKGTLLAHAQLSIHHNTQVLHCKATFQPGSPSRRRCMALFLLALHSPSMNFMRFLLACFQTAKVPLHGTTSAWALKPTPHFCVVAKEKNKPICTCKFYVFCNFSFLMAITATKRLWNFIAYNCLDWELRVRKMWNIV